jgi:hypothetical protein
MEVEQRLEHLYQEYPEGFYNEEVMSKIKQLEIRKNNILMDKDKYWRIKSRENWLSLGDQNTKCFHKFSNFRKSQNIIWEFFDDDDN